MKNKKICLVVSVLLLCVIYFGYKGFNLFYYNSGTISNEEYKKFVKGLEVKDTITIKKDSVKDNNYLSFKNMKIRNDFTNFKLLENQYSNDSIKYVLHDENGNIKSSFWMSVGDTYINLLKSDKTLFGSNEKRTSNENLLSFIEKNNIKSDVELFKYLREHSDIDNNIFTSVKEMKQNFNIKFLSFVMLPAINNISLINGDYTGYIFNLEKDFKEVSIIKNNKRYIFTFMKLDYFTDEYIKELLNTIEIDDTNSVSQYEDISTLSSKTVSTEILVRFDGTLYGKSFSVIDYEERAKSIGTIDKLTESRFIPKLNNETNTKDILNSTVYDKTDNTIVIKYNNEYVLFEKIK